MSADSGHPVPEPAQADIWRLPNILKVEARLALDGLRDGLLVELAGLGETALRHLGAAAPESAEGNLDADALEQALVRATTRWLQAPPPGEPPPPGRLASLPKHRSSLRWRRWATRSA